MHRALPPLALAFCAGAALGLAARLPWAAPAFALLCALGLLGLRGHRRLAVVLALALAASVGAWRASAWRVLPADSVAHLADRRWARLHGVVIAGPEARDWGAWVNLDVDRADTRREPLRATGRVRVYLGNGLPASIRYGDRVAVEGRVSLPDSAANPGEIPPAQYLRREGIVATVSAHAVHRESGHGGNPVMALALRARTMLERGIAATSRAEHAGLLRGLLFSDSTALPETTRDAFARSGVVHILSTSGIHIALLSGVMAFLLPARRPDARRVRSVVLLGALIFFALMTGLRPAVTRAVLMTGAALAAPLFDREPDVWCSLSLAALALVLWSPGNLLDPGFQLSFAAALALALWFVGRAPAGPPPPRAVRWARAGVEASVIATLATWPLAAQFFGSVSLASPLANLIIVPLVAPCMGMGLLQGLLWPAAPGLAVAVGALNAWALGAILGVAATISAWPWSAVPVNALSAAGVAAALAALFGALALWRVPSNRRPLRSPAWALAGATLAAVWLGWVAWLPRPLRVTFLDVGQGDATLIQTPGGRVALVDAGGSYEDEAWGGGARAVGWDLGRRVVVPALKRAGVRRIDVVVLTHPHEDHAGGLPAVMNAYPVGLWLDTGQPHPSPGYRGALEAARQRGIPYRRAYAGQRVDLGDGVTLEILSPERENPSGDLNNNGIVCRVVHGQTAMLLCGDAEAAREERMIQAGETLLADVLKVGHHGSAAATSAPFLRAVAPAYAVISCGRNNRYGHPAEAALERLDEAHAQVYRTDRDGAVVAISDGARVRLRASRWLEP